MVVAWPSGKAGACKALIPSSNLGATFSKIDFMLTLIATPIGNLQDISLRGLEVLKEADLILAEDTRISMRLLKKYEIDTPLLSFHKFNEWRREAGVIAKLKAGKQIALISDAGTPGICDPGTKLVKRCREEGISVTAVPGPSAFTMALSLIGEEFSRFQFLGFLPKKTGKLKKTVEGILAYPGLSIAYDTPHHLEKTLKTTEMIAPASHIFIARELTKIHEECIQGTPGELLGHFKEGIRGELVLIFKGSDDRD
jgi:16S rRNA (cytidine1402-2'-O)-methyltransferase